MKLNCSLFEQIEAIMFIVLRVNILRLGDHHDATEFPGL